MPDSSDLVCLVYRSSAHESWSHTNLCELLELARNKNKEHNITGLLLYKDRAFIQYLEGPEAEVVQLYGNIQKDERHTGVVTLCQELLPNRIFSEWSMGFENLSHLTNSSLEGYEDLFGEGITQLLNKEIETRAIALIKRFRGSSPTMRGLR